MAEQKTQDISGNPGTVNENIDIESGRADGAAAQPLPGDGGGSGTNPCNTVTDRYGERQKEEEQEGSQGFRALLSGIDSLYLSYAGDIFPAENAELSILKHLAQSPYPEDKAQAQKQIGDHIFEVWDKRQGSFAYILQDAAYRICVKSTESARLPLAWAQLSSYLLTHRLPVQAVDELTAIVQELGEGPSIPNVSRADLFVDFICDIDFNAISDEAWITEGHKLTRHMHSGQLTGWSFSPGGILSARFYDKTREIREKSKKTYLYDIWKRNGWDGEKPVWRMEFQFMREVLKSFGVMTFDQLEDKLGSLWATVTHSWLRLAIPSPTDSNRSRWPTHRIWEHLMAIRWRLDDVPLTRAYSPARVPGDEYLARTAFAVTTSFMAKYNLRDYDEGVADLTDMTKATVGARCQDKLNTTFESHVAAQVSVKTRQFNARRNTRTPEQEATTPDDVERAAKDYDDESNGA